MRRPLIRGKDFQTSIGQGGQAQGRVMEAYKMGREYLVFWEGKGGEWVCVREINSYVWKGVIHGKNVCKQEHGKKLCVASICSGSHGRISMTKPMDFYLK